MLLDYETKFCTKELRPISRTFFTYPASNTAYQFKYFTQLVVWALMFIKGRNWEPTWDEYDDPSTLTTNITVALKEAGIQVSAVPAKLKVGSGDGVCSVL